jgi:hypothetical protein
MGVMCSGMMLRVIYWCLASCVLNVFGSVLADTVGVDQYVA